MICSPALKQLLDGLGHLIAAPACSTKSSRAAGREAAPRAALWLRFCGRFLCVAEPYDDGVSFRRKERIGVGVE